MWNVALLRKTVANDKTCNFEVQTPNSSLKSLLRTIAGEQTALLSGVAAVAPVSRGQSIQQAPAWSSSRAALSQRRGAPSQRRAAAG